MNVKTHQINTAVRATVNGPWYSGRTGRVVGHRMGDEITVVRFTMSPVILPANYLPAYDIPITTDVALPTGIVVPA